HAPELCAPPRREEKDTKKNRFRQSKGSGAPRGNSFAFSDAKNTRPIIPSYWGCHLGQSSVPQPETDDLSAASTILPAAWSRVMLLASPSEVPKGDRSLIAVLGGEVRLEYQEGCPSAIATYGPRLAIDCNLGMRNEGPRPLIPLQRLADVDDVVGAV